MDVIIGIIVNTVATLTDLLAAWTASLAGKTVLCRLSASNTAFVPGLGLGTITQASFGGYAPVTVSSWDGPFTDAGGNGFVTTNLCLFSGSGVGAPQNIYGVYLTESTGAAATATATESGGVVNAITVTGGGTGYLAPPVVTITDATTGVGATAVAVLTAGAVSAINITNGGTLYTGPIITIEKPCKLLGGFNLATPQSMGAALTGLPAVVEVSLP